MNKKVITGVILSSIVLASCGKKEVTQIVEDSLSTSTPVVQEESIQNSPVLAANYEQYNEGSLGESENTVIFFHASWCGTCKATHDSLLSTGIPENIKVLQADFDTETELRKKYGVVKEHTFVQVDAEGNEIKKWSGSMNADDISEQLNESAMMEDKMMKKDDYEAMMEKEDSDVMEEKEVMIKEEDSSEVMMEKNEEIMEQESPIAEKQIIAQGTFANYTPELVGNSENTVIFFAAAWCPSCVALEKGITGGMVPQGLTILKADFDTETELRKKYGVVSQHTLVQVDAEGNEIKKWAGGSTIDSIVEKLK